MRYTAEVSGLSAALKIEEIKASMAAMKGITRAGNALKEQLRDQVRAAGFSERLAKTWQGEIYPQGGKPSLHPAAYVYSKAPRIIDGYARGATIVATGGRRFLAIPTYDTPLERSGKALTPAKVEERFGRALRFVPARSAQGSAIGGKAVGYLILDGVVARKSTGRYRNASPRERRLEGTGKARPVQSVVMFTLVRAVKLRKVFDLQATADAVAATVPQLIAESWSDA